jgi:hypothetical protein
MARQGINAETMRQQNLEKQVRERPLFLRHFIVKMIVLPRQARGQT